MTAAPIPLHLGILTTSLSAEAGGLFEDRKSVV